MFWLDLKFIDWPTHEKHEIKCSTSEDDFTVLSHFHNLRQFPFIQNSVQYNRNLTLGPTHYIDQPSASILIHCLVNLIP